MNIYFSGIGGVGIGPLAEIAADAGYSVAGSDLVDSLTTDQLRARGITIQIGPQDGEFLRAQHAQAPIDWFVYTAALPSNHPELVAARDLGIRTAKRDELLAHIIAEKDLRLIAIAGTHGKTTTTGMLVWALQQLDVPVSYSVGTTLGWGPSGRYDPASRYFVYECDEYDRNFLHFHPYLSLITTIDYDHPDTYPTEPDYMAAFRQFVDQSDMTIMWRVDGDHIDATANDGWILQENEVADIHLPGAHNRRNATLVMKAIEYLSTHTPTPARDVQHPLNRRDVPGRASRAPQAGPWPPVERPGEGEDAGRPRASIPPILASFPGTDRRFERLADNLYSDYGHHPAEIAATLQLARELSDHVVLVYQPHQNIRQHEIRGDYTNDIFSNADEIYWLPTYLSREDPGLEILTPTQLAGYIDRAKLHTADLDDDLWDAINHHRDAGHLVLAMGAGTIDGWLRQRLT